LVYYGEASLQALGPYLAPPKETNFAPARMRPDEHMRNSGAAPPCGCKVKENSLKEGEEENTPGA